MGKILSIGLIGVGLLIVAGSLWWATGNRRFQSWNWDWMYEDPLQNLPAPRFSPESVRIEIVPDTALEDEPFRVFRIEGLHPGQVVGVRATTHDHENKPWESAALFRADAQGTVDLTRQAPLRGTYHRGDPMGLLWSMRPRIPERAPVFLPPENGYVVTFTVHDGNNVLARQQVVRLLRLPDIPCEEIQENQLVGIYCRPLGEGPFPAVLLIGGSEGYHAHRYTLWAAWWASHGVAAFAQGYFGPPPLPRHLARIPIETFLEGLSWLRGRPEVDPQKVFVMGGSRGSEAALLTGIHADPPPAGVIAWMPSHALWMGLDFRRGPQPAWTWKHQDLPFASTGWSMEILRLMIGQPARLRSLYEKAIRRGTPENAVIAVERLKTPLLLISGTDDQMWPSTEMAKEMVNRMESHGLGDHVRHLALQGAGHVLFHGYRPPVRLIPPYLTGGQTREANVDGGLRAWKAMLDFVQGHEGVEP